MASEHPGHNRQASIHIPRPSGYSYFTEQAHRFRFMGTELGWTSVEHFQDYGHLQHLHFYPHHQPSPPPHIHDLDAIQIEREKERIRSEIIMSEIARRRILEAEVRRELMMERELALGQCRGGSSFGSTTAMGFNLPVRLPHVAASEAPTVWIGSDVLRIPEVNPGARQGKQKEKIVLRAKPDDSISGSKRKNETPPLKVDAGGDILVKKARTEWTCDLCQVSATSKRGLGEHMQGRKHRAKEAASKVQSTGKNYCIGFCPKKATKSTQVLKAANPSTEDGLKLKSESLLIQKAGGLSSEREVLPKLQEDSNLKKLKKKKTKPAVAINVPKSTVRKIAFKHWCDLCQVGAYSDGVMNDHKRGKKHALRAHNGNQNEPGQVEAPQDGKNIAPDDGDKALGEANTDADQYCMDAAEREDHEHPAQSSQELSGMLSSKDTADSEELKITN